MHKQGHVKLLPPKVSKSAADWLVHSALRFCAWVQCYYARYLLTICLPLLHHVQELRVGGCKVLRSVVKHQAWHPSWRPWQRAILL